jgi:hypothetical protein
MRLLRLFLLCLVPMGLSLPLRAIPAWARLTGSACNACHMTPTLQLTRQGEEFLRNGHRLEATKYDPKDISFNNYASMDWEFSASRVSGQATSVSQPTVNVFTGGALSERLSFFAEADITFSGNGQQSDNSIDQAYLQYNQPVGDGFVALRGGRIAPNILHAMGLGQPGNDQFFGDTLGAGGLKGNAVTPWESNQGVDLQLNMGPWQIAAGMLNGPANNLPQDKGYHNDSFFSAQYNFTKVSLGAYHFTGNYHVYTTDGDPTSGFLFTDRYTTDQVFVKVFGEKWRITASGYQGRDEVDELGTKVKNGGGYLLGAYSFTDTFGAYARADVYKADRSLTANQIRQQLVGVNGFLHMSNHTGARWSFEYSRATYAALDSTNNQLSALVMWVF